MYNLCQWLVGEKKIHENCLEETNIDSVIDSYDSLFNHIGFNTVVSVSNGTHLPLIKITENGNLKATLFFEKV